MSAYSHDPVIDAELAALADGRVSEPEAHPFDGKFEPSAEAASKANPRIPLSEIAQASIAISLKRIADAMTGPVNNYGETIWEAIPGEMRRGNQHGRY